jgi:hypothetical protein
MPHGFCYLWSPGLVWLHAGSDSLITLAYSTIPVTLVYFMRKRRDLPFNWVFISFGIFILACGGTHAMDVWTLWHATYWLSGAVKLITAIASVTTAIMLVHIVPQALALPSPETLRLEVAERKLAEEALSKANRRLIEAHEEERARIARELHDDINQRVALLAMQLDRMRQDLPASAADLKHDIEEANKQVSELETISKPCRTGYTPRSWNIWDWRQPSLAFAESFLIGMESKLTFTPRASRKSCRTRYPYVSSASCKKLSRTRRSIAVPGDSRSRSQVL